MKSSDTFKGSSVFMSRNLVPPEIFDALHDALKLNGADVFLCCDPSRNGPNDYHIISSLEHEKFEDLRAKGCNLLGPHCVLTCAKEHRPLPKEGFTCCLALDGVKVLASGFEMDEKVKIGKLVTGMGGVLHTKATMDVSFVIVKNVSAAKYKWASNILKKPIVTVNWLYQCWNEHRVVPQESFKVLPFYGLTICVTRIRADERKEVEKLIIHNGGKYSAELTRKCTHLISDAPEGDKYKVAQRWGNIHIVSRKWFDQSIARRACLSEELYPVQGGSISSIKTVRAIPQHSQGKCIGNSQPAASSVADSYVPAVPCDVFTDPDLEATVSQNMSSTFSDAPVFTNEGDDQVATMQPRNELNLDGCVADDSETEDNDDLYLSDCRIFLVGFEACEMRKLVNMVRQGGGSRYMLSNEKLTHIIVGTPSEIEKREVRSLAALGVIYVVNTTWLEDCDREKKEVPVAQRHIASNLLLPKAHLSLTSDKLLENTNSGKPEICRNGEATVRLNNKSLSSVADDKSKVQLKMQHDSNVQNRTSSTVFSGRRFRFSNSFPEDRRAEIVQWVNQGGGEVVDDHVIQNVNFTIECHGMIHKYADVSKTTFVSSHWIRSCLEVQDGCLLDVGSHILYSPLPCQIPFHGFERFRFCVSQYEEKDRLLLKNLCFVLGAKLVEKLTKKITHLLCKFADGPKYKAACKWGIKSITSEWLYECVRQNKVVSVESFCPKEVTPQDREAGLCTMTQFPTQAIRLISGENSSQFLSQSEELKTTQSQVTVNRNNSFRDEANQSSGCSKRTRLLEDEEHNGMFLSGAHQNYPACNISSTKNDLSKDAGEVSHIVPDVAAAIEDLLEQTSKIQDLKSPWSTACDKTVYSSDCSILGQEQSDSYSLSGWLNRAEKKDEICDSKGVGAGIYDGFSETQTDSQVVVYEEDLSGRQMIIDRVKTRSSLT